MADDTRHAAVVESLKATASELHARPPEEMNQDWADRMAEALAAAGLLAAPADEAGQWVKQIDNPKELPGLLLRMADLLDALESLPASLRRCADVARIQANASPAAQAARLPKGAASQIAAAVHNTLCDCMGSNTGITLRSRDWDLVRDAVAALLESWQGASPAAPADDEAAVERMARALLAHQHGVWVADCKHEPSDYTIAAARAALAALREGLPEWQCPGCGATTRARMADHPTASTP